jgi:hypothetical protein
VVIWYRPNTAEVQTSRPPISKGQIGQVYSGIRSVYFIRFDAGTVAIEKGAVRAHFRIEST